jgi:hypothetical protein
MSMSARHLILAGLLASASAAQALTIFADDFDADTNGLNKTSFVGGWTVANGTVDMIGAPPPFFDLIPGNGHYVDLDGSTSNAGEFSKVLSLIGGVTYTASFQLAGSHRGDTNIVDVSFGASLGTFTLASADPLGTQTLVFTPGASGLFSLTFANRGGDNLGALLDNVEVATAVIPEPSTYALMLAGLAGIGFVARRRTQR